MVAASQAQFEFVFIFIMIVVVIVVLNYAAKQRRRKAMAALAQQLGFAFDPAKRGVPAWGDGFELFRRGRARRSYNHLAGYWQELQVEVFDYHYDTGSGKSRSTHSQTVIYASLPEIFPAILIKPDTALREFFEFLGGADIDFESDEFNRRYCVRSADRPFAFKLIDAQMMAFLLDAPRVTIEISGNGAIFFMTKRLKPDEIIWMLNFATDFHDRIPEFVRKDYARE